jgi:urea transporter
VFRTAVAVAILLFYCGVVIWRSDSAAVTVMGPALSIAVGYLLGRDMLDIFAKRKERSDERS